MMFVIVTNLAHRMIPFHIELQGSQNGDYRSIIIKALHNSLLDHAGSNFSVTSMHWENNTFSIDGLTNRTPQGSFECQFATSGANRELRRLLQSSQNLRFVCCEEMIRQIVYNSSDAALIVMGILVSIALIALAVWIMRQPDRPHHRNSTGLGELRMMLS